MQSFEKNPLRSHGSTATNANIDQVDTIERENGDDNFTLVHPCLPIEKISNGESMDLIFSTQMIGCSVWKY